MYDHFETNYQVCNFFFEYTVFGSTNKSISPNIYSWKFELRYIILNLLLLTSADLEMQLMQLYQCDGT